MDKYLQVAATSFKQELAYPINFVMWRLRNIIQILLVYFLWNAAFSTPDRVLFGYDKNMILTYIFGIMLVRAFVLSSKTSDVAGEIARGELSNSMVKPLNYFMYWFSRDLASKALNLLFAISEIIILALILKIPIFIQSNPAVILAFLLSIVVGILLYTVFLFIVSSVTFWMPEMGWGAHFLLSVIIVEFLSGVLFPLDVLPSAFQSVISFTPFPYLVYFPLQVYLGKLGGAELLKGFTMDFLWLGILFITLKFIWNKGLKAYQAYGR